jgi:hypothetical protein
LLVPELPGAVAEISFVNHFLLKRGYPHVACRVTAIDAEGQRIEARLHPIEEPRVYRFRLTGSVDAPVETYMVEFFAADNLFIPFPAVMINHHGPGFYNTVHAFNRVLNDVFENDAINAEQGAEASIDVDLSGGRDTFAVFTSGPTACRGELALDLATPGREYHAAVAVDRPRLTQQLVSVRETFPDVDGRPRSPQDPPARPVPLLWADAGIRCRTARSAPTTATTTAPACPKYWEDGRGSYRSYPHFPSFQSAIRMYPVQSPGGLQLTVGSTAPTGRSSRARRLRGEPRAAGARGRRGHPGARRRGRAGGRARSSSTPTPQTAPRCRAARTTGWPTRAASSSINVSLFNPNVYTPAAGTDVGAVDRATDHRASRSSVTAGRRRLRRGDGVLRRVRPRGDLTRRLVAGGAVEIDPREISASQEESRGRSG